MLPRRRKTKPRLSPVDENRIGERLKELRRRRGVTQVELAEKLGLSQALVSAYERGALRLHGVLLAALAATLKSSPNEILGFERIKDDGVLSDRRFLRRLQRVGKLSKNDKLALLKTIDAFLLKIPPNRR